LKTSFIPSKKERVLADMKDDEERLPEYRWPYSSSRAKIPRHEAPLVTHPDSLHKPTLASNLKAQAAHSRLEQMEQQAKREQDLMNEKKERLKVIVIHHYFHSVTI
jgi:hypothetical protein